MSFNIYLSPPFVDDTEKNWLKQVIDSGWVTPGGPIVSAFEQKLSEYFETSVLALQSGTSAIHLALQVADVSPHDYVLCPTFTFCATVNPIIYQSAIPVFVDCDSESWTMDMNLLDTAYHWCLNKGKRPKALIFVHNYGMIGHADEIMAWAQNRGILVIEDAAEAFGAQINNKKAGTWGDIAVLSFNGNKIITTGGGGALLSKNEKFISQARHLSTQARIESDNFIHDAVGNNYRMSSLCAGVGMAQLEKKEVIIELKRKIFLNYKSKLKAYPQFEIKDFTYTNHWLSLLKTKEIEPYLIINKLKDQKIESRRVWYPLHHQKPYSGYPSFTNGTSDTLYQQYICLPSGSQLTENELDKIISVITS